MVCSSGMMSTTDFNSLQPGQRDSIAEALKCISISV